MAEAAGTANSSNGEAISELPEAISVAADQQQTVARAGEADRALALFCHRAAKDLAVAYEGEHPREVILAPFLRLYRQAYELHLKATIRCISLLRRMDAGGEDLTSELAALDARLREPKLGHSLELLLTEMLAQYGAINVAAFPAGITRVVKLLHTDDSFGAPYQYFHGEGLVTEHAADFAGFAALLDEQLMKFGEVIDRLDGHCAPKLDTSQSP
jgi:hypothetical protein